MKKTLFILLILCSIVTFAQDKKTDPTTSKTEVKTDAQKWKVRLRAIAAIPQPSATIGVIGGGINISNSYVPELDFTYYLSKYFAAELILGTTHHSVNTTASNLSALGITQPTNVDLGKVWLLPPTLNLQYHIPTTSGFEPYIGAGVNYTIFYGVDHGTTVNGVSYQNKFGTSLQIGFDYNISKNCFLNVDVKKIFLKTNATVDASNLAKGLSIPADVTINPWVIGIGIGTRF